MICNIFIVLWIALIIGIVVILFKYAYSRPNAVFLFQTGKNNDIQYISMDIQGNQFNMLVDTGAGISIIRSDFVPMLEYTNSPRKINYGALTSDSIKSSVVSIPITINKKVVVEDFAMYDSDDIANFEALYGITLHGILGAEFFEKTDCKIDYKKHCLIIP